MNDFVRKLLTEWRRLELPSAGETFVAAVSGGADSCALAIALDELRKREKLKLKFVLAHFNHKLRGSESDEDEKFVRELADRYDFELVAENAESFDKKENLEQSARRARYAFLRRVAENFRARGVLTAHTVNDQAETFLLNLIRGSGIEGLSAMKAIRSLESEVKSLESEEKSEILLVRPLLNWAKRFDTENFCREKSLPFRADSMNEDTAFKRVRVRRVLIPMLEDFNPKIVETLAATARILGDDAEILRTLTPAFDEAEISINDLKNLSSPMRRRVLRRWLATRRGNIRRLESAHIEAVEKLVLSEKSGRTVELPNNERIVKGGGRLRFEKNIEKS